MDLIDRSKIDFYKLTGPELVSAMEEAPSVPAMPLDKLCGMLSKFVGNPPCPCGYDLKGIGCNPDWTRKDCWKNALTTWMEENK